MVEKLRVAAILGCLVPNAAGALECEATSGWLTQPLVELYISERCPACAQAERWLLTLGARAPTTVTLVVPIDDAAGSAERASRRRLTLRQRLALEHAPLVLLQAREAPHWRSEAFAEELQRLAARPAQAELSLRGGRVAGGLSVQARVRLRADDSRHLQLYLAAYGQVAQGNERRMILEWQGPFPVAASRGFSRPRTLSTVPGLGRERAGAAAFLQRRRGGEVLQAVTLPPCPG